MLRKLNLAYKFTGWASRPVTSVHGVEAPAALVNLHAHLQVRFVGSLPGFGLIDSEAGNSAGD